MEFSQFKIIEFTASSSINFDAIISTMDNSLDIRLEKLNLTTDNAKDTYWKSFEKGVEKGKAVGSRMTRDRGSKSLEKEEVIKAKNLEAMTNYRIVIIVKNTDLDEAR
jgi:hypothetical protein